VNCWKALRGRKEAFFAFDLCVFPRLLLFTEEKGFFYVLTSSRYHDKCLLSVQLLQTSQHLFAVTAATDGRVCFWDLTETAAAAMSTDVRRDNKEEWTRPPVCELSAHQSGVNAVSFQQISGGEREAQCQRKAGADF
jgi:hypothetical protein